MNSRVKFDLHTHHDRCGHAVGKIRDYIESAIELKLDVIGIADHSPYFHSEVDHLHPQITMARSEFPTYINEVLELKKQYKDDIDVLLGVESDFFPEYLTYYRNELAKYPFDYIIGSVHSVKDVSIFNKNRWNGLTIKAKSELKDAYYRLIGQFAKTGLFQILGHIDAMKAYYPAFSEINSPELEKTLEIIGEYDIAIEVNTSGSEKDCGGWYPADDILEKALYYGVDITFGSDSHKPERVGEDFELVKQRLKEIGFGEWCYFKARKKITVPII